MRAMWILAILTLGMLGCQEQKINTMIKTIKGNGGKKIAILTFENLTPNSKAGEDFAQYCYNQLFVELYGKYHGKLGPVEFNLMDPQQLRVIMEKEKWMDQSSYVDVGLDKFVEKLGCDLILLGTVSEYHYKKGLGEDPVASLHLRLYHAGSRTIIWSGSLSQVGRFSWFKEDSLGRLAQQVATELVQAMCKDVSAGG